MKFDFPTVIQFIIYGGFFGGLSSYLAYIIYGQDGRFKDRLQPSGLWIGVLFLNGLVGISGAFAIQLLVLGMRFYEKVDQPRVSDFVFLSAVCIIGGFGARSFLPRLTRMFEEKIGELDKKTEKALTAAEEAKKVVATQDERSSLIAQLTAEVHDGAKDETLEFAVETARIQLEKEPFNASFVIILGRALRRLKKESEAIDELTKYINARQQVSGPDKNLSAILYNRACYYCALNEKEPNASYIAHAISDLEQSLRHSEHLEQDKLFAQNDPDLIPLRDHPRFKALTAPETKTTA